MNVDGTTITAVQGDLTAMDVDAIVNAANEHLAHGGGLAAAIVRAGGPVIQEESTAWVAEHGPLEPGRAAVTGAGSLAARLVVHVAGPRYRGDGSDAPLLGKAVGAALEAATAEDARSVALPAISAGIFGYPLAEATAVIAEQVVAWCGDHPGTLETVLLVGFDETTADAFASALERQIDSPR